MKDYDSTIMYHPGKANVVANALSRKSMGSLAHITPIRRPLIEEIRKLELKGVHFKLNGFGIFVACLRARSSLADKIRKAQCEDPKMKRLMEDV